MHDARDRESLPAAGIRILPARTADELQSVADLIRAYEGSLHGLGYQDFESGSGDLPGAYASPQGELLLARNAFGRPAGCAGLRPLDRAGRCEMKRLYVSPEARGTGLGRALVQAIVEAARRAGYREMLLDTHETMSAAQALYRSVGFEPTDAYCDVPVPGAIFMRLRLDG